MKSVRAALLNETYRYMAKDPTKNLPRLIDWAEKVMAQKDFYKTQRRLTASCGRNP